MARRFFYFDSIIQNLKSLLRSYRYVFICNSINNDEIVSWLKFCAENEAFITSNKLKFILPIPQSLDMEIFKSLRHSDFLLVPFEEFFKINEEEPSEFLNYMDKNWKVSIDGINKILNALFNSKNEEMNQGMRRFKVNLNGKNIIFDYEGIVTSTESLIIESVNALTLEIKFIESKISFINTSSNISISLTRQQSAFLIFEAFKPIDLDTLFNSELYFKKFNLNLPKKMSVVHSQRNQLNNKFENLGGLRIKNNFERYLTLNCTHNTFTDIIYNLDNQTKSSLLEVINVVKQLG